MEHRPTQMQNRPDSLPAAAAAADTLRTAMRSPDIGPPIRHTADDHVVLNRAMLRWRDSRFPAYKSYKARVRSYFNWPRRSGPTPEQLSIAGFFYTGKQSCATHYSSFFCFSL
jgi:hypothetical protein